MFSNIPSLTVGVLFGATELCRLTNPDREGGDASDDTKKILFTRSEH